ncbi:potassium transporter Kup [Pseudoroseicyclus tamaricis]|uniref:Probable potassium transport system protein Kup n=1 Tax=Pseudoroseicyclus tamaricis TaxID=2705421 RepID=A0A6B2JWJ1_9RHOB|nr:KUP/HAK/KT family potassium transporter [Pseudoroseicyclus tamaricis]NDU99731.1 potassium transporter Kup [Pseudoroseicyclus tamaricis]
MSAFDAGYAGDRQPSVSGTLSLSLGSAGIVYGDIGTSPLYALRESLRAAAPADPALAAAAASANVTGVVSLLVWLLIVIVTLKYVVLMLRADNRGEGGTLSLLALCERALGRRGRWVLIAGIVGTALFFGDAMITPAISVLSATEGLTYLSPGFERWVLPAAVGILVLLFLAQRSGTARVGRWFGPIMLVWFVTLAALGLRQIIAEPRILLALNPVVGISFLLTHLGAAMPILGAVFLAVTGAEALYADMGHFGRRPIRLAWFALVLPGLMLAYLGQGALVLSRPEAAADPFFLMVPEAALPALLVLAAAATIIAAQAVITGAFSVAHQAAQLGLVPRLRARHTSETHAGQIYLPQVNLLLFLFVVLLVLTFASSERLATAYGIAVTGVMLVTSALAIVVFAHVWRWRPALLALVFGPLVALEALLLAATLTKIGDGGWLPLTVAAGLVLVMIVWAEGTRLVLVKSAGEAVPLTRLIADIEHSPRIARVRGTAVFLSAQPVAAPRALLHNLKHNGVLHERNIVVTVATADRPHVPLAEVPEVMQLSESFLRVRLTFGYMDTPNLPVALKQAVKFDVMQTSFFLNHRSFKLSPKKGLTRLRHMLFAGLYRASSSPGEYFHLPSNRVVELGQQLTL